MEVVLAELSDKHSVRVDTVDDELLRTQTIALYIVNVHQRLERFLLDLQREHPRGAAWDMNTKGDLLTKTMRAIGSGDHLEAEICHYYRLLRNATTHRASSKQLAALATTQAQLRARATSVGLRAPNLFSELEFDDFVLHTRMVKDLAAILCQEARPTNDELKTIAMEFARSSGRLKGLKENRQRLLNSMSAHLQSVYSMHRVEADAIAQDSLA